MSVYFFQFSFCGPNKHENIDLLARVADSHHFNADPDPAFLFYADPDPWHLFNVIENCDLGL
jgi:hypothetical protein